MHGLKRAEAAGFTAPPLLDRTPFAGSAFLATDACAADLSTPGMLEKSSLRRSKWDNPRIRDSIMQLFMILLKSLQQTVDPSDIHGSARRNPVAA